MRVVLAGFVVLALAKTAAANDPKIAAAIRLYDKEATACRKDIAGLAKVGERGKALAASDAEVAANLEVLAKAQATVQVYCDDVASTLEWLRADPKVKYKAIERELDKRDSAIRAGRKASKRALEEGNGLIRVLVPKINAQVGSAAPPPEKKTPGKFPSGRTVELPVLAGTWKVSGSATTDIAEYTEKALSASVTVRAFSGATCDQQRKALAGKSDRLDDIEITKPLEPFKPAWYVAYAAGDRTVRVACMTTAAGKAGWVATIDARADAKLPLDAIAARMLTAHQKP